MMKVVCLLILLLTLIAVHEATNPGLKFRLSQKGLNYALGVGVDVLTSKLRGKTLPDQSGKSRIGPGKVEWTLSGSKSSPKNYRGISLLCNIAKLAKLYSGVLNKRLSKFLENNNKFADEQNGFRPDGSGLDHVMRITSFGKPRSSIKLSSAGLTVSLSQASIAVHGDWKYKVRLLIPIKDHGSFDVSASDISISLSVSLGKTAEGKPNIWTTGCTSYLDHVKVKFHGGASWLYNLFDKYVEGALKKNLRKQLCEQATKTVNENARKQLATMPTSVTIEHLLDLDYSLITNPVFTSSYMESNHKGEFFWHGDHSEAPFSAEPMPSLGASTPMLQICVSPYVLDTLGYVLQKHAMITYILSKADLPKGQQGLLDTTCKSTLCIGGFVPKLGKLYPGKSLVIIMSVTSAPKVSIQPGVVEIKFAGNFRYEVQIDAKTTKYVFTTSVNATVKGTAAFEGQRITGKVISIDPTLKVTDSAIGDVPSTGLNFLFKAASSFIIPKLNELGQKGLMIPSVKNVEFVNPKTSLLKNGLLISTDVKYTPNNNNLYFAPY